LTKEDLSVRTFNLPGPSTMYLLYPTPLGPA